MKTFIPLLLVLSACTYNDVCPQAQELKKLNAEILQEESKITELASQPPTPEVIGQISQELDILETLQDEKMSLQNNQCK